MNKETAKGYTQFALIIVFLLCIYLLNFGLRLLKTDPKINNQSGENIAINTVTLKAVNEKISFQEVARIGVRSYIPIIPEAVGRITYVAPNFKTGSCFKKDQLLFKIDADNAQADYDTALAQSQQAEANLALIQAEADAAIAEWEILNPNQKIPDLVAQKPQLAQAQANLKSTKARLKLTKINLSDTRFSYPFAGCVESSNVEIGQFATMGQSLGRVYAFDALEASISVSTQIAQRLQQIAYDIHLMIDGQNYPAKIDRISEVIDNDTQLRTISLKIKDMKNIQPNRVSQAFLTTKAPIDIFKLTDSDLTSDQQIRVLDENHKLYFQNADILGRTDDEIYIPAKTNQITLIRGSYFNLKEGMIVKSAISED